MLLLWGIPSWLRHVAKGWLLLAPRAVVLPAGMQVRGEMSIRRLDTIIAEDVQV